VNSSVLVTVQCVKKYRTLVSYPLQKLTEFMMKRVLTLVIL